MLLNDLTALYERLIERYDPLVDKDALRPVGYAVKPVRFIVDLDTAGRCLSIDDTAPQRTRRTVPIHSSQRTSALAPTLAIDNVHYVLGVAKTASPAAATRAAAVHGAYLDQLRAAAAALREADPAGAVALEAIATFVTDTDHALAEFTRRGIAFTPNGGGKVVAAEDLVAFFIAGDDPTQRPAVRDWWAGRVTADLADGHDGICQISGQRGPMARKMPSISVTGSGQAALISANFPAAQRYCAKQSSAAQLSLTVALHSHQALNWLLANPDHHRRIGDTLYTWWVDGDDGGLDPMSFVMEPNEQHVAALLSGPWTGRPGLSELTTFRVLALTSRKGRLVIRLDHHSTLQELQRHIGRFLHLTARPGPGGTTWWPTLYALGDAVAPRRPDTSNPRHDRAVEALAATALRGTPPPPWLLADLVERCRANPIPTKERNGSGKDPSTSIDRTAIGARLAALTVCRTLTQEDTMPDPTAPSVAELCGRILAQLDAIQSAALGTLNRTLAERYYASASTRPGHVIPALFGSAQAHLAKIGRRDDGRPAKIALSRGLEELHHQLLNAGGYPPTLEIAAQADFALGYWDHRHNRFAKTENPENPDTTTEPKE